MNQELVDNIRTFISLNKIEDAIELLGKLLPNNSDIVLLNRRLNELNNKIEIKTISNEDADVEKAKIGKAILDLIDTATNPTSTHNPINNRDLSEVINTLKSIQKPYYYISGILILLGVGCSIYFGVKSDFSAVEILTSGFFALSGGVPLSAALKKNESIKRANFFMKVTPQQLSKKPIKNLSINFRL